MRQQAPIPEQKRRKIGFGLGLAALILGLIVLYVLFDAGLETYGALAFLLLLAISIGLFNFGRGK